MIKVRVSLRNSLHRKKNARKERGANTTDGKRIVPSE